MYVWYIYLHERLIFMVSMLVNIQSSHRSVMGYVRFSWKCWSKLSLHKLRSSLRVEYLDPLLSWESKGHSTPPPMPRKTPGNSWGSLIKELWNPLIVLGKTWTAREEFFPLRLPFHTLKGHTFEVWGLEVSSDLSTNLAPKFWCYPTTPPPIFSHFEYPIIEGLVQMIFRSSKIGGDF